MLFFIIKVYRVTWDARDAQIALWRPGALQSHWTVFYMRNSIPPILIEEMGHTSAKELAFGSVDAEFDSIL